MMQKMLFLFISIILSNDVNQKPQITEKIIKEIHYGYHHLKAVSTRQNIKTVYAPDTTPHGYPSWPYMHVSETDTLFFESNYYISDKSANYDNEYFRPNHIKVKRDTLIQFIKQIDELKTRYRINDQKKQIGWGSQIRSYVLHPYKLIKDLRSNHESSDVNAILDGEIDGFLEKSLYL